MKNLLEEGLERGLIRFDEDKNFITYVHQNKKRNFTNPEEKVQANAFLALVLRYNYPVKRVKNFVPVKMGADMKDLKKVIVDTTVMPKNIEFPTDSKLLGKARERLVKLAAKNGIALRQNYNLYQTDEARKESCVDRGYKGHGVESDPLRNHTKIFISGQRKGLTKSLKKQLKRRSAIEPMIGHMKHEGKLGLCRLKGIVGDQLNALLTGVGHNLRLILNHIRKLMRLKKAKEFFDPNFIPSAGDIFTENLSTWELLVWGMGSSVRTT